MKIFKSLFLLLCASVIFSSCSRSYYYASSQNVPLFKEKGEISTTGSIDISLGNELLTATQLSGAYAFSDKFFAVANGAYVVSDNNGKGVTADAGLGYYKVLNQHSHRNAIFELQTVGGFMNTELNSSVNMYRAYIQPAIGYRTRFADVLLSSRFSGIYAEEERLGATAFPENDPTRNFRLEKGYHYLAEPGFILRFGFENFMLHQQINILLPISTKKIIANPVTFSGGVTLRFPANKKD